MSQNKILEISNSLWASHNFQYCVLPGKYFGNTHAGIYRKLYEFWQWQWTATFNEIGLDFSPTSEEFCRHEEVTCIINNDQIVACALLDYFSIDDIVQSNHHYFNNYPPSVKSIIQRLSQDRPVFTFGFLAIHPDFRKHYCLSDVILGLAIKRVQELTDSILITYTRNTRRTNDLTYRLGAKTIVKDLIVRGEPSDFVYFNETSIESTNRHPLHPQILELWDKKIFVQSKNILEKTSTKGKDNEYNQLDISL